MALRRVQIARHMCVCLFSEKCVWPLLSLPTARSEENSKHHTGATCTRRDEESAEKTNETSVLRRERVKVCLHGHRDAIRVFMCSCKDLHCPMANERERERGREYWPCLLIAKEKASPRWHTKCEVHQNHSQIYSFALYSSQHQGWFVWKMLRSIYHSTHCTRHWCIWNM